MWRHFYMTMREAFQNTDLHPTLYVQALEQYQKKGQAEQGLEAYLNGTGRSTKNYGSLGYKSWNRGTSQTKIKRYHRSNKMISEEGGCHTVHAFIKPEEYNHWIKNQLESFKEPDFQAFTSRLLPGVKHILGVRLPKLREMARQLSKGDWEGYLLHASDGTYEEIMLQGMVLGYAKGSLPKKEPYLQSFIPKIDNWSVCDSACNTIRLAKEQPEEMWDFLQPYLHSSHTYEARFALVQLLLYYVDTPYLSRTLYAIGEVKADGYYAKMAQAWALSICYREFPKETLPFLRENRLDDFTHNKAIQKILESQKVSAEEKKTARRLKRENKRK